MSTRGFIAREISGAEETFEGRFHHWDSYPPELGKTLFRLYNKDFNKDTGHLLHILLDEHTAWSTINGKNFNLKPGLTQDSCVRPTHNGDDKLYEQELQAYYKTDDYIRPQCYCHGPGKDDEEGFWIKKEDLADTDTEWGYIFMKDAPIMVILCKKANWEAVATVDLEGPEPDWKIIQCGENLERCPHYAWVHDKTICKNCNGKGVTSAGGHRVGYGTCTKNCVPTPYAPLALRGDNPPQWHFIKPKGKYGFTCKNCKGTGKNGKEA